MALPPPTTVADKTVTDSRTTPETYLNAGQIQNYVGDKLTLNQPKDYHFPTTFPVNGVSLDGTWTLSYENLTAGPNARIGLYYQGKNVYLVLAGQGSVTVTANNTPTRTIPVSGTPSLSPLITELQLRDTQLTVSLTPGLQAYVFTFG